VLRGDLDAVVVCALQKDPYQRYATVERLCEDVERWLGGEPVAVRRPRLQRRLPSLLRRRPRVTAATLACVAFLLGLTTIYTTRLSSERDRARVEAAKAARISSFILQVFEGADPEQARGRTVTARQLLDQGSREIGSGLEGQSLTEAELSLLLAEINDQMGAPERAVPLLERALELAQGSGATPEWKVRVMLRLARLYRARGEPAEADRLLALVHVLTGRAIGPDDEERVALLAGPGELRSPGDPSGRQQ
jgi:serine/threonine-protein kinase